MPGSRGSSFGGGMILTDWRQRGHRTLKGSVGSRVSSKVRLIAHCGQLAIILDLSSVSDRPVLNLIYTSGIAVRLSLSLNSLNHALPGCIGHSARCVASLVAPAQH